MAVAYDATGAGFAGATTGSAKTFSHTAAAGAYVLLFITTDRSAPPSSVTYNSVSMTSLGSIANDNLAADGTCYLYGTASVAGGAKTVSFTVATAWVEACTVSYTGVSTVGATQTTFGSGTALSQGSISCSTGQMIVQAFGLGNDNVTTYSISSLSGGTNRYNAAATDSSAMAINDATSNTTFSATANSTSKWAGLAVQLVPSYSATLPGVGTLTAIAFNATIQTIRGAGHGLLTPNVVPKLPALLVGQGVLSVVAQPSTFVTYDATGVGANGVNLGGSPVSGTPFNHTAASGADVFLAIQATGSATAPSGVNYNGSPMTLLGSQTVANTGTDQGTYLYRAIRGGTGSAESFTYTIPASAWYVAGSVSYTGVAGVTPVIKADGSSTSISSGSIPVGTNQFALCAFGSGFTTVRTMSAVAGGVNRYTATTSTPGEANLAISDSNSTATFSATLSSTGGPWSTVAVILMPLGAAPLSGRGALTATAVKFGAVAGHGALTATAVATKFTLTAHLAGHGASPSQYAAYPTNNPLFFAFNHLQNNLSSNIQALGDSITYGFADNLTTPFFHGWVGYFVTLLGQYCNANVTIAQWNDQSALTVGGSWPDEGDSGQFYDAPYSLRSISGGAATLQMLGGGSCGQELNYLDDATRLPVMLGTPNLDVIILATVINDYDVANDTPTTYVSLYKSWLTSIQTLCPGVPIIVTNESKTNYSEDLHFAALSSALWTALAGQSPTYCGPAGSGYPYVYMLDTRSMYTNLTTQVQPSNAFNGIHPVAAGYLAQAQGMLQTLAPGITWPGQPAGHGALSATVRSTFCPASGHGALSGAVLAKAVVSAGSVGHGVLSAVAGGVIPLPGHGTLSATTTATKFVLTAHPAGVGTLSGIFRPKFAAAASLAGNGALLGNHGNIALPTGHGALTAPIKVKIKPTIAGSGALSVTVQPNENPVPAGHGTLTATTLPIRAIAVSVTGTGQLTLTAGVFTTAVPSGSGALTAIAHAKKFILAAALAGHGVLQTKQFLGVNLAGRGALTCTAINIGATVLFDAAGDGYTSTNATSASWFHPATPGAGVVVVVFSQPNPASVHYGNTMMTEIGRVTVSDGFGYLTFYGLLNVAGSDTVSVTWGIPARDIVANSVSYNGANLIGTSQGISNQYGYISTQPEITCPGKSAIVHAFAGVATESGGYNFADYTGGNSRWSFPLDEVTTGPTTAMCLIGDSTTSTAFTAKLNTRQRHAYVWASYTVTLRLVI